MLMQTKPDQTEFPRAKRTVERLLKYRLRSENEIVVKLKTKGYSPATISQTVSFYRRIGVLDDTLFARAWISSRLNKPLGVKRIRWELTKSGIGTEIIEQELRRALDGYDEKETAGRIAQKRMQLYHRIDFKKAKLRLMAYLMRRGFSMETVQHVIYNIRENRNDDR
jgi:regulatory protein